MYTFIQLVKRPTSNSYHGLSTCMGDNPLVDYLPYRWTTMEKRFYTNYIVLDLAHYNIFCAKVGKNGIKVCN